jgi:hypothetical protein
MNTSILKCPACNSDLCLRLAFSGCDWETEAGEGSGYKYPLSLDCTNDRCARIFTLGYLKGYECFSQVKEHKPYAIR